MSEFLIVGIDLRPRALLAVPLVARIADRSRRADPAAREVAFGEPQGRAAPVQASYVPLFAHLGLVLVAGIYLPAPLVAWFEHVAGLLG